MQLQDNTPLEFPEQSGIYAIVNVINDKHYIGSAINFKIRRRSHFNELKRNEHKNSKLQNSWNAHWSNDFIFVILEYCKKERLIEQEQLWIDKLNPEYNILKIAGSVLGHRHDAKARVKMSANQNRSQETKKRRSEALIGRKQTAEHIANMVKGKRNYKHSEETKKKIGKANKISLKGRKHTEETKAKIRLKKGGLWWEKLSSYPISLSFESTRLKELGLKCQNP